MSRRVAAIGLDAMEWSFAERLMDEGSMPNLARLRDRSARWRLSTVVPYRSELPWTLFLTGREPEVNRYWSTVEFDPATYAAYTVGAHAARPFYALGPSTKVLAFDVPHAVPDEAIHGVQVMAWGAHSAQYPRASEPRGLLTEIDAEFGPHPGFNSDYDGAWYSPRFLEKMTEAQLEGAARRVDILLWLQQREPDWDLLLTVMSEAHSAGHHLWHGVDGSHPLRTLDDGTTHLAAQLLTDVYRSMDEHLGRLLASLPDDASVVVFSVHGMQANANDVPSMVLLPELLHRAHFGHSKLGAPRSRRWLRAGSPPLRPDERHAWETTVRRRFGSGFTGWTRRFTTAAMPVALNEALLRLRRRLTGRPEPRPPFEFRDHLPPETMEPREDVLGRKGNLSWQPPSWYREHWPAMRWFVLPTFSDAHVRLNIAGRERDGIVELTDYKATCDEFEELVRACANPRTGRPAVADVIRVREDDPMAPDGPDADLVVLWTEPLDALEHPDHGIIGPVAFARTGEHSSNGFAMVAGNGIDPGDFGMASAYDVTPTILGLLGKTPPADLAGSDLLRGSAAPTG